MFRVLESLCWEVPDGSWSPAAIWAIQRFGKAFMELKQLGLIDRFPAWRLSTPPASINRLVSTAACVGMAAATIAPREEVLRRNGRRERRAHATSPAR